MVVIVLFLCALYTQRMSFCSPARLLRISRPRFWIYLLGPYLIGILAAFEKGMALDNRVFLFLLFFTLPANLLLYGINDVFDYETDKLNPKKQGYEELVEPALRKPLIAVILLLNLPFLLVVGSLSLRALMVLCLFVLVSVFYSAPPIRAKARPFLDSAFNILYLLPGVVGFVLLSNAPMRWSVLLAAACWCAAMHAYSAIPDINVDKAAHTLTIATVLGAKNCLILCGTLYLLSALFSFSVLGVLSLIGGGVYLCLMIWSAQKTTVQEQLALYRLFPWINTLVGATLFLFLLLQRF